MASKKFPANPTDRMIYEASPGLFYQYSAGEATWVKLQGYDQQIELATPLRDGLMTAEDLRKLNGLMVPPPKTTLTAENCNYTFDQGMFGFRSSKKHLFIESELSTFETLESGEKVEIKRLWKIHENTFGINFRVNLPLLVADLEKRGKLTYHKSIGEQGEKGDTGEQGINKLDTGPRGKPGEDGKNASFPGFLSAETGNIVTQDNNRAIVDIQTTEISPEEYVLTAIRANIGNPDFCPTKVIPKDIKSKWIVVTDERPVARRVLACDDNSAPRCATLCPPGSSSISEPRYSLVQNFCSTRLYYLDMAPIEVEIKNRFTQLLTEMKAAKEKIVTEWLMVMIQVFNEQKLSLCCALENCRSRRENQDHRRYIETQRMQGAIANVKIKVSGNAQDQQVVETNPPGSINPFSPVGPDGTGSSGTTGTVCNSRNTISCSDNSPTEEQAIKTELAAGTYEAVITDCCCYSSEVLNEEEYKAGLADINNIKPSAQAEFKKMTPYLGTLMFKYQPTPNNSTIVRAFDLGSFHTKEEASAAYSGKKVKFTHAGGIFKAWFAGGKPSTSALGNSGKMELCLNLVSPTTRALTRDISTGSGSGSGSGSDFDPCAGPVAELDINCALNISQANAVVVPDFPEGEYLAEISDCCCRAQTLSGDVVLSGLKGTIALEYEALGGRTTLFNTDLGTFNDFNDAINAYLGNSFLFRHRGGDLKVWTTVRNNTGNAGQIRVTIRKKECVDIPPPIVEPEVTADPPEIPAFTSCEMSLDQIQFYEAGWQSEACCGVYIEAAGVRWLVIQRSLGSDNTCGGGESANSDCIRKAADHEFYPAFAFPTIDGCQFFGKPTSGPVPFVRDNALEVDIINKIAEGEFLKSIGSPDAIAAILFPGA
jgi:hypothetical protein